MIYKEKNNTSARDLLSVGRNLSATRSNLESKTQTKSNMESVQQLKQILLVYVDELERMYIKRSSLYALGLIDTRAIMISGSDDLIEIDKVQLASISSRDNIEIKMEKVNMKEKLPQRPKIKVYKKDLEYFIEMSAAYSLGLITTETFNLMANELYAVGENLLVFLENKYDVEYYELAADIGGRK